MDKAHRLTRPKDFGAVRREGRSWADGVLVLLAQRNSLDVSRVGFAVGRRVGKAVVRNKTKRRLREAVRAVPVQNGWDLVIIARRGAASADFHGLNRSVMGLFRRAGILETSPGRTPQTRKAK